MSTLPDVRGAPPGVRTLGDADALSHLDSVIDTSGLPAPVHEPLAIGLRRRLFTLEVRWQFPLAVYLLSRVLYLMVALADTVRPGVVFLKTLYAWDGHWYAQLAVHGYPNHVVAGGWSTLGFFPLYSIAMWTTGELTGLPYFYAGLLVSLVTGATATVLIARLAQRWWGNAHTTRRAVLFFCVFPGSIVFSMDYTEGLLLTLIAGCLLALEDRRWLLAGLLAGLSTAVGPVAVAIIPACALATVPELRRATGTAGRRVLQTLRPLLAPALAPLGILAFGGYLWVHTGTPFATFVAQHDAWHEHSSPFALAFDAYHLVAQVLAFHSFAHPSIDLNLVSGLAGTVFLGWGLLHLWRSRALVPAPALAWTGGVALLTVTSDNVPPNPRMLLCAFPLLLAVAARLQGAAYRRLIFTSSCLLVGMSLLAFAGNSPRP